MSKLWSRIRRGLSTLLRSDGADARLWHQVAELKNASSVIDLAQRRSVFQPRLQEAPSERRILVLAPHPDDEVIGPGGTLALAKDRGCEIGIVYATSQGFAGAQTRVAEAKAACSLQGYEANFLPLAPGQIPLTEEAASRLVEAIDAFQPSLVFLPFFLDDHDDHRRLLQLLLLAAKQAAAPWHFTIWAYQVYSAAALPAVVDITGAVAAKRRAIECYASEMTKRNWAHYALGQNAAASRYLLSGAAESYAELFYISDFDGYLDLLERYFAAGHCYHNSYLED